MHKLIQATRRRSAGVAAGLILTGGMAGGVLLTPVAAYAAGATPTSTSVTATVQGSTISVSVSVTPSSATGPVSVSDGSGGCSTSVGGGGQGGGPGDFGIGNGTCQIRNVAAGSYTVTATYQGSGTYAGSSDSTTADVSGPSIPAPGPGPSGSAPVWSSDSPSTSVDGTTYSAQFQASGSPSYELVGAPSWLSIGPDGAVSGNIPDGTNSFTFSVKAWNNFGFITAGPFNVFCHHQYNYHNYNNYAFVNLHTSLYCTSPVYNGGRGACTLRVTNSDYNYPWGPYGQYNNFGQNFASDVTAQISLPDQLRARFCGFGYGYGFFGCRIFGNTVTENLGNLYPGQSRSLTVSFTVRNGFGLWGYGPGHSFYVKVVGSAFSGHNGYNFFGQGASYSVAYVKIVPYRFFI